MPVALLIALSGDLYAKKDNTVYCFKKVAVHQVIFMILVFMAVGLLFFAGR